MRNVKLLLPVVLLATLMACIPQRLNSQVKGDDVIPSGDDVNQSITLTALSGWNTFNLNDPIWLLISPYSEHKLTLNEKNLLIYQLVDNKWIQIENGNPHLSMEFIMLPSEIFSGKLSCRLWRYRSYCHNLVKLSLFVISANIYDKETYWR